MPREQARTELRRRFLIQTRMALAEDDIDNLEDRVEAILRRGYRTQVTIIALLLSCLGYMVARDVFGENVKHEYQQEINRPWQTNNLPVINPPKPNQ